MKITTVLLPAVLSIAITTNAFALGVGDPAPELKASKWLKGDAIAKLETNQTYVVEFWATWCGPCVQAIPHLTQLAHKHKGNVTFIGMDVLENGAAKVKKSEDFVKKMGEKMDYNVAMDTEDGFMAKNWLEAAKQPGIPTAFIVNQGKIVWIGHPAVELETVLEKVVEGKYDSKAAEKRSAAKAKLNAFFEKAREGASEADLQKEGKELEALDKELGDLMSGGKKFETAEAIRIARYQAAMEKYEQALIEDKSAEEIARCEAAAEAVVPAGMNFNEVKAFMTKWAAQKKESKRISGTVMAYFKAVSGEGEKEKIAELAKKIEALNIKDPEILNKIAGEILDSDKVKQRDLSLAEKLAGTGVDITGGKDPAILGTYARALFDSGKAAEAVESQKKAVAACKNPEMKGELEATLKKYQASVRPPVLPSSGNNP